MYLTCIYIYTCGWKEGGYVSHLRVFPTLKFSHTSPTRCQYIHRTFSGLFPNITFSRRRQSNPMLSSDKHSEKPPVDLTQFLILETDMNSVPSVANIISRVAFSALWMFVTFKVFDSITYSSLKLLCCILRIYDSFCRFGFRLVVNP